MKKMKIALILFTSFLIPILGFSQAVTTQSSVEFKIKNLGFNVDGYFSEVNIESNFKAEDISQWTLSGNVKVNSIITDNKERDEHLLKEDFFDAKTYSEITLKATDIKNISDNKYDVTVNFTIKKTTKSMIIPMLINTSDDGTEMQCYFEINRKDFDVGGSSLVLSNTVKINVKHTAKKQ